MQVCQIVFSFIQFSFPFKKGTILSDICWPLFQNKREILRRLNQNLKAQEDEKGKKECKNTSESAGSEDGKEQQEGDHILLGDRKKWKSGASELVVPLAQLSMEDSLSGTDRKYPFFVTMILVNQFTMCSVCFYKSNTLYYYCLVISCMSFASEKQVVMYSLG